MTQFTKVVETRQYTETIYYSDGIEVARETHLDDHAYDAAAPEPMTQEEIEAWT